jgi:hypothetical protein
MVRVVVERVPEFGFPVAADAGAAAGRREPPRARTLLVLLFAELEGLTCNEVVR